MNWINLKVIGERTKQYIAWAQFIMIGYIFIQQTEFNLVTTVLLILISLSVISVIDFKWILPAELNRISEKNPVLMEIRKEVREINQKVS